MADAMVWFQRDGKDVEATMDTDLPHETGGETVYPFRWSCNSESEAELVTRYLQDRMDKVIEGIRRDAYRKGWKDAKTKKHGKATLFETWFGVADDGGCW